MVITVPMMVMTTAKTTKALSNDDNCSNSAANVQKESQSTPVLFEEELPLVSRILEDIVNWKWSKNISEEEIVKDEHSSHFGTLEQACRTILDINGLFYKTTCLVHLEEEHAIKTCSSGLNCSNCKSEQRLENLPTHV